MQTGRNNIRGSYLLVIMLQFSNSPAPLSSITPAHARELLTHPRVEHEKTEVRVRVAVATPLVIESSEKRNTEKDSMQTGRNNIRGSYLLVIMTIPEKFAVFCVHSA